MRLEELKNEMPEVPDFIHTMICEEVENQIGKSKVVSMKKKRISHWNMGRIAAAAAICILGTSTIAYAGTKVYHLFSEREGNYGVVIGIEADEDGENYSIPAKIHEVSVEAGYMPAGLEWYEEGVKLHFSDADQDGGISILTDLLGTDEIDSLVHDRYVVESEKRMFGEHEGIYLKVDDVMETYDQRIYLFFPEEYRVLTLVISGDIAKEEVVKFAENITLKEEPTMIHTANMPRWGEEPEEEVTGEEIDLSIEQNEMLVRLIGESFPMISSVEDENGDLYLTDELHICVDEIRIEDDLSLIDDAALPDVWKHAAGADGKLLPNHITYYKANDGATALAEAVSERTVDQKLVYVNVSYTNQSDKDMKNLLYLGALNTYELRNHRYIPYDSREGSGEGYDFSRCDGVAQCSEMTYYDTNNGYGNGGNYISVLKPGETKQVKMAWILNEDELEEAYLDFSAGIGSSDYTANVKKYGVVKVVQ